MSAEPPVQGAHRTRRHPRTKAGYSGLKDGALLDRIDGTFDVFITIDGNLTYQQNLTDRRIAVVVLRAVTNAFEDVEPLVKSILEVLQTVEAGDVVYVGRGTE